MMKTINVPYYKDLPYALEESLNRLRINLGFLGSDIKTIMVVSTFPNEGKSFIASQMWRQMAEAGVDTALVDIDMRNSTMALKSGFSKEEADSITGTASYLAGEMPIEDALMHTQLEHGDVMYNMQNVINPSMLLESDRFTEMMSYLKAHYRYVFMDAPPLDLVSDGERIGNHCDGAIMVVRANETPIKAVKASISQLERAGCPVLGYVLNRVTTSKAGYYKKGYGGYYGKYYGKYYGGEYYGDHKK